MFESKTDYNFVTIIRYFCEKTSLGQKTTPAAKCLPETSHTSKERGKSPNKESVVSFGRGQMAEKKLKKRTRQNRGHILQIGGKSKIKKCTDIIQCRFCGRMTQMRHLRGHIIRHNKKYVNAPLEDITLAEGEEVVDPFWTTPRGRFDSF